MTRRGVTRVEWGKERGRTGRVCVYLHEEKGQEEGNNQGLNCGGKRGRKGIRERYMCI